MSESATREIMRTLRPTLKGFEYYGWTIEYPTLGTSHKFKLVDPRDRSKIYLFASLSQAKKFAEANNRLTPDDIRAAALAIQMKEGEQK